MAYFFKVVEVIDGDTIRVSPSWTWEHKTGEKVKVFGYKTPQPGMKGFEFAKLKLENLIKDRMVELRIPSVVNPNLLFYNDGSLLCEVYLNEVNISNYFPEFLSS